MRGLGAVAPHLHIDCMHDRFEKLYNNYVLEPVLVDGTMLFETSLHGVERKRRGWAQPHPFANTTSLSRVLKGSIWLLFLLAG